MTGTLPSIPLAQNIDENGLPQSGCRLFVYEANTSTPVITYKDLLMSVGMEHSWPIVADALGRIPMFFIPDGYYRARLEDRYGSPIYDEPNLPALSTGEGGGGGGAPAAVQWVTGDFIWQPVQGIRELWVRANGRTIGNALSGAGERANADCANLFSFLWHNFDDALCHVHPDRGASGAADFNANKQITTYDMRGFSPIGLDGMGNADAGRFAGVVGIYGGANTPGAKAGANVQAMTGAQMPYHDHPARTTVSVSLTDGGHTHSYADTYVSASGGGVSVMGGGSAGSQDQIRTTQGASANVYVGSATGSTIIDPVGGGAAQNNLHMVALGTWFIRL